MKEQITIRLPAELKERLQHEADRRGVKKNITLRLEAKLHNELERMAEKTGLSITALIIVSIWWHFLMPQRKPL